MYHNSPPSVEQNDKRPKIWHTHLFKKKLHQVDSATERECQLMTARANQTTGLTNVFSPFLALFHHQLMFLFCCQISLLRQDAK